MSDETNQANIFPPDRKAPPADQVEQHPDERDEGTPEPQPGQAGAVLDLKAEPPTEPVPAGPAEGRGALTRAAEAVPVLAHGAAPSNFAHQITMAQYMAKAQLMVPQHFHGNVGDCLAIIDIATRAGLSPYQVAAKTYKDPKGKGIAFESQLYHAFLIGSGWLKDAALHCEYDGAGEDMTCTVWGTLKGEIAPRYYTSPPLKDLLPAKNESGAYKGSPLWGDKPKVQMFYDTTRDWGRMFCPIATLGMLAQYESIEHPLPAPGGIERDDSLRARIQSTKEGDEGHRNGHAEAELAATAADRGTISPAGEHTGIKPAGKTTKAKAAPKKTPEKKEPEIKATKPTAAQKAAASKKAASAAADRAEATSAKNKAKQQPAEPPKVPAKPTSEAEYQIYCLDWIKRIADPEDALARWGSERDLREQCGVRTAMRNDMRERIEKKHGV